MCRVRFAALDAVVVGAVALGGLVLVELVALVGHAGVELLGSLAGVVVVADLDTVELVDLPHRRGVGLGVRGVEPELDHEVALLGGAVGRLVGDHPGVVEVGLLLDLRLVALVAVVVPAVDEHLDVVLAGRDGGVVLRGRDHPQSGGVLLGTGGRGERESRDGGDGEEGAHDLGACGTSHDEPHFLLEGTKLNVCYHQVTIYLYPKFV